MKGLIYKDLLSLKQILITMAALSVFYVALGTMGSDSEGVVNYFPMLALIINMMASLSCGGYDEQCGWDSFGSALPVSRAQIVLARYGMNLIVILLTTVMVIVSEFAYHLVWHSGISAAAILYPIVVSLGYLAITNPIIYKFGANKGRWMIVAILVIPMVLFAAGIIFLFTTGDIEEVSFSDTSVSWSDQALVEDEEEYDIEINVDDYLDNVGNYLETHSVPLSVGLVTVSGGLYALSALLSISIYKKKEF